MTNEENSKNNEPVNNDKQQGDYETTQKNEKAFSSGEIDLSIIDTDTKEEQDEEPTNDYKFGNQIKTALLITDENLQRPAPKPKSPDDIRVGIDTKVMSRSNLRRAREEALQLEPQEKGTDLVIKHEVVIVVRGMVERLSLEVGKTYILGRTDLKSRSMPDIDLTPYGALDRGVSREHATIQLKDKHIYITDLESTNGTFVAGERLAPHEPQILHRGDSLELGRLAVQVMFR